MRGGRSSGGQCENALSYEFPGHHALSFGSILTRPWIPTRARVTGGTPIIIGQTGSTSNSCTLKKKRNSSRRAVVRIFGGANEAVRCRRVMRCLFCADRQRVRPSIQSVVTQPANPTLRTWAAVCTYSAPRASRLGAL